MAAAAGLSVTLIPVLMGYWIRGRIPDEQRNPITRALIAVYRPALEWVLAVAEGHAGASPLLAAGHHRLAADAAGRRIPAAARRGRPAVHAVGAAGPVGAEGGRAAAADQPHDQDRARGRARVRQGRPRRNRHRPGAAGDVRDHDPAQAARAVARRHDARASWSRSSTARCKVPGLSNIWVPPIRNRIDMLATGIKSPIGVKVTRQRPGGDRPRRAAHRAGGQGRAGRVVGAGRAADRRALRRRRHRPRRGGALRPEHRRRAGGGRRRDRRRERHRDGRGPGALPGQPALPARVARHAAAPGRACRS